MANHKEPTPIVAQQIPSSQLRELFIAHAPLAIAMFDREMRYVVASRRWLDDYGLNGRDLKGLSHYTVFPDIPDRWREIHRRGLRGEVVTCAEDRFDRADGTVQWLRWEVQPWYDGASQGGIVVFTEDITDRKRAEALFRATFELAPVGMIMTDAGGSIALVNAEAERMFGYDRNELLNAGVDSLVPERYRAHHAQYRARFCDAPASRPMGIGRELFGLRKDGTEFPTEIGLSPVNTDDGLFILSAIVDITKRKQLIDAKEKAEDLATRDFLTGLPNRVLLLDRVSQAIAIAKRHRRMAAVLSLDIDDFKKVNDRYGHGAGDSLLVEIAARMRSSVRESDTVTRWGGDEFIVLAPEVDSIAHVETMAAHVLEKLRQPFDFDGKELHVTFSIGIAIYPRDGTTAEALIANSDRGLYIAKGRGKNRIAFAS